VSVLYPQSLKFLTFPYLLTIHLLRFDFDYTTFRRIKLNHRWRFLLCHLSDNSLTLLTVSTFIEFCLVVFVIITLVPYFRAYTPHTRITHTHIYPALVRTAVYPAPWRQYQRPMFPPCRPPMRQISRVKMDGTPLPADGDCSLSRQTRVKARSCYISCQLHPDKVD